MNWQQDLHTASKDARYLLIRSPQDDRGRRSFEIIYWSKDRNGGQWRTNTGAIFHKVWRHSWQETSWVELTND